MLEQLALTAIFLVGSFTMSFAGFGFAMVSVPLLAMLFPVKVAVALQFPYCFLLFAYQAWHYRDNFCWLDIKPLAWGSVVGLTLGTFMLHQLPEAALKRALALFIASVVLFNLSPWSKGRALAFVRSPWWGRFCGLITGAFMGAYTIGGPPAVVYITSISLEPQRAKSFMASLFSVQFMVMAVVYGGAGMFTWELFKTTMLYSPVVLLGAMVGYWAFNRASVSTYRLVVQIMLLVAAGFLWWRA